MANLLPGMATPSLMVTRTLTVPARVTMTTSSLGTKNSMPSPHSSLRRTSRQFLAEPSAESVAVVQS